MKAHETFRLVFQIYLLATFLPFPIYVIRINYVYYVHFMYVFLQLPASPQENRNVSLTQPLFEANHLQLPSVFTLYV